VSNNVPEKICWHILRRLAALVLCIAANLGTTVAAYDWNRDYGIDATIGRDDNFRLTEDDPVSTTSTSLGVFADLQGATEISSIRFAIGAGATAYSESSIEDSENYYVTFATMRRGERWSGNLDLSYNLEPTTESELLDTGRLVDGERIAVIIAPGASYQLDERNSIYANLSFNDVTYDTVSLTEYTDTSVSVGWVNQFSETSEASLNGRIGDYDPEDDDTTTVTSFNVGYRWNTSDATQYNLALGYAERESPTETERDGDSSFEIRHSIDERNGFSILIANGFEPSGEGQVRYENRLNLRWDHALTERMQFLLTAEGVESDDRDYIEIVAGGSHQYTREIRFAANYRYRTQQNDTNDADSNSIGFSLSWSPI
jgi:hypothetical protein